MKTPTGRDGGGIVRPAGARAQDRGRDAERMAIEHLERNGLKTIARNVRCRGGEIDLISMDRGTVVFVEVRLRSGSRFGGAAASITTSKQKRILLAANWWLTGDGRAHASRACRFDAVLLESLDARGITWIKGAFDASSS